MIQLWNFSVFGSKRTRTALNDDVLVVDGHATNARVVKLGRLVAHEWHQPHV